MKLPRLAALSILIAASAAAEPTSAPLATAATAAADQRLGLRDAIDRAVKGNVDLQRERVTIQAADAQLTALQGQFDFLLTTTLSFSRRTQPQLGAQDIASGFTNDYGLDLGLLRRLETGGQLRLSTQTDAFQSNSRTQCGTLPPEPATSCFYYGSNLNLEFTHPLLRGFGAEIAQAQIRKQRIQKDLALLNRQTRAANVIRDVVLSYWELAYATQDLAIRRSAVDLAREQLRITKAQIDVGRLAPVDAAAVERAIGDREQEVVSSEERLFFRTLELKRLFGVPPEAAQAAFAANDAPSGTPRDVDSAAELGKALDSNPQLRALRLGLRLSAIDLETARQTLLPKLDFVGRVGATGRKNDLAETLAQAAGLDEMTWSAALTFELPIENRVARGQTRAAELGAQAAELDARSLELGIRDLVLRIASNVRTASKRVELARRTVGFAEQNLEAEKARFSVGRSTNNEVLLRQQELKNAEIQSVRAMVDLLNGETALLAATGEILDRYGVSLRGL